MERNILKSVAIEKLACAIDDFSLYGSAVTSGVRHGISMVLRVGKYASNSGSFLAKHYLEHILTRCSSAGKVSKSRRTHEDNDERRKESERTGKFADATANDRQCGRHVWRSRPRLN